MIPISTQQMTMQMTMVIKTSFPPTSDVGEMSIDVEHSQGVDDKCGDGNLDDSNGGESDEEDGSSEEEEEAREGAKRFEAENANANKVSM